jgi:hypothetical protein
MAAEAADDGSEEDEQGLHVDTPMRTGWRCVRLGQYIRYGHAGNGEGMSQAGHGRRMIRDESPIGLRGLLGGLRIGVGRGDGAGVRAAGVDFSEVGDG